MAVIRVVDFDLPAVWDLALVLLLVVLVGVAVGGVIFARRQKRLDTIWLDREIVAERNRAAVTQQEALAKVVECREVIAGLRGTMGRNMDQIMEAVEALHDPIDREMMLQVLSMSRRTADEAMRPSSSAGWSPAVQSGPAPPQDVIPSFEVEVATSEVARNGSGGRR